MICCAFVAVIAVCYRTTTFTPTLYTPAGATLRCSLYARTFLPRGNVALITFLVTLRCYVYRYRVYGLLLTFTPYVPFGYCCSAPTLRVRCCRLLRLLYAFYHCCLTRVDIISRLPRLLLPHCRCRLPRCGSVVIPVDYVGYCWLRCCLCVCPQFDFAFVRLLLPHVTYIGSCVYCGLLLRLLVVVRVCVAFVTRITPVRALRLLHFGCRHCPSPLIPSSVTTLIIIIAACPYTALRCAVCIRLLRSFALILPR